MRCVRTSAMDAHRLGTRSVRTLLRDILRVNCVVAFLTIIYLSPAVAADPLPSVSKLQVFLYYHERGEFDERDLVRRELALRNTPIGEGDARGPSGAIMVRVEIERPHLSDASDVGDQILEVHVSGLAPEASQQQVNLGAFWSDSSRIHVPLVFVGTICKDLSVRGILRRGSEVLSEKTAIVHASCGE